MSRRSQTATRAARLPATYAQARRRAEQLRAQIAHHDYRYYVLDRPSISDAAYDALMRSLQAIEGRFPTLVTPDSPTQRVAGEVREGFRTIAHRAPMRSLESTTDADAVRQFDARIRAAVGPSLRYVLEPKFDGLSIEVVYERGRMVSASTRGDGDRGEDVTANVKSMRAVPLRLRTADVAPPALLAVRGEVIMRRTDFAALNARLRRAGEPLFANPRNAAAGSVRQLDARITASRALDVVFYDVLAVRGGRRAVAASQYLPWLRVWGLKTSRDGRLGTTANDILDYRDRMSAARDLLDFDIDGVVAKVDSLAARDRLGTTARHPRWALGAKFTARSATTRLEGVETQVGRTGVLTPVAVLTPVQLGGVTVSRATLHNWGDLRRRQLRIGDIVEVARAGDVIPEIVRSVRRAGRRQPLPAPPTTCPACRARVESRGPFRACPNALGCPAQRARAIQHFAARGAFDIDGLGPRTVRALIEGGLVESAADLFALTDDDLRGLPRFGALLAARLFAAINAARRIELDRFLIALGIPGVGPATARQLADRFHTLQAIRRASVSSLAAARGVGPAAAREIARFFNRPGTRNTVDALLRHGVTVVGRRAGATGPLAGQRVVFTGRLESMPRPAAERLVERLGGQPGHGVTGHTSLLVAGSDPGSKLARARALGVPVLSEREFLRRFGEAR